MRPFFVSIIYALVLAKASATSVGFQPVTVPDAEGKPLAVGIWYPSNGQPSPQPLAMFIQLVIANGKISGDGLPLILMSSPTSGSLASNCDTALALAQAGFVVAAITHTGDNNADQSYTGSRKNLIDRPRQVKLVTDYMVLTWAEHTHLDPKRIGIFGFSLGGFTALVEIGGMPDLRRIALLCTTRPDAPECSFIRQRHGDPLEPVEGNPAWVHDPRIKAAFVAAPAVSFLFGSGGLHSVTIPVGLWRAENDSQAPDPWNSAVVRQELPRPPAEHVVRGVDHFVFLAPCSDALARAVPQICRDAPDFDRTAFHSEFNRAVVAFFREELKWARM